MIRPALLTLGLLLGATPALARQTDDGMAPGMAMSATPIPPTLAEPPDWNGDYAADRDFDPQAMAKARAATKDAMGGMTFSKFTLNLAERQSGSGADGYRWQGEAWWGGDFDRLVVKTEGQGQSGEGTETAELQALYSRAVGRYTDLQAGVRQDVSPRARSYLALGVESRLPFRVETEGSLYLSPKGDLLARIEGAYDLRLLQRLVLQPRAELNFAARDVPETRTGSGLSDAELGLRLRYEFRRELAPYVGVSWERRFGRTADYWKAVGEDRQSTRFVFGLSAWF